MEKENKRKVFISHSSANKEFVDKLTRDLNENGIDTWYDKTEIMPGDNLMEKLQEGLDEATHYIFVLSPEALESKWVEYEVESTFLNTKEKGIKKFIPVKYRECKILANLGAYLHIDLSDQTVYFRHNRLEFHGDKYASELNRLIKAIKKKDLILTPEEKEEIINLDANVSAQDDDSIETSLSLVGFKSKSQFYDAFFDQEDWHRTEKSKSDFNPLVLPVVLREYLAPVKFGDIISIEYKGKKVNADFAKFSHNNTRLALPREIRKPLDLKIRRRYLIRVNKEESLIEFVKEKED